MGGSGSGSSGRVDKKLTVEESLSLAIWDFRDRLHAPSSGAFTWTLASGNQSTIGYFLTWGKTPSITLHYRWHYCEDVKIPVRLQSTPTQFSGIRWWFTCPLIIDGVACGSRVGKLYLPPRSRYFGCRKCHRLTYRSCQEAHLEKRLFARMGFGNGWIAENQGLDGIEALITDDSVRNQPSSKSDVAVALASAPLETYR